MDDLIRRSDATALAIKLASSKWKASYIRALFDSLHAVEPKQAWIPCEERLPSDTHKLYLVNVIIPDAPYKIIVSKDVANDYIHGWVDAWMPLPEPYMKGADNE